MEVCSIWSNKIRFPLRWGCFNNIVPVHYMDANKTHGENGRWELQKNAICYFEQILQTTLYKTVAVPPLSSHLTNHPSKTNKTCWRSKVKLIRDVLLWTLTHGWASVNRPAKTYLHHLCVDTGCSLEDLLRAMDDKDGEGRRESRKSVIEIIWLCANKLSLLNENNY